MDASRVRLVDCTLRDGGNKNDWRFPWPTIRRVTHTMLASGVDVVEVGYYGGSGSVDSSRIGPAAHCDQSFFRRLGVEPSLRERLAVMVSGKTAVVERTSELLKLPVGMIRVAVYPWTYSRALPLLARLSASEHDVCLNIMAVSRLTPAEVGTMVEKAAASGVRRVCLADSFGALTPTQTAAMVEAAICRGVEVGFHGHDNMGLAMANALTAVGVGATWLDGAITGLARGAGNIPLEHVVAWLNREGAGSRYDLWAITRLADEVVRPLRRLSDRDCADTVTGLVAAGLHGVHYLFTPHVVEAARRHGVPVADVFAAVARELPTSVSDSTADEAAAQLGLAYSQETPS